MSKTNDTSKPATLDDHCPLADSELDAVSGGIWFMGNLSPTAPVDVASVLAQAVGKNLPW